MPNCPACGAPVLAVPRADTGELIQLEPQERHDGVMVLIGRVAWPLISAPRPEPRYRLHAPRCAAAPEGAANEPMP